MVSLESSNSTSDFDRCAREAIHSIGQIQPHGVLFGVSEPDLVVRQVSTNAGALFGLPPENILGSPLITLLGISDFGTLKAKALSADVLADNPCRLRVGVDSLEFQCVAHRNDGTLIIELESLQGAHSLEPLNLNAHILQPLSRMEQAQDIQILSQLAASEIRRLSGFDRVMVYRFDEEWNGEVIAEETSPSPVSYLGLHFPASDIPAQARRLFLLNRLRSIVDIDAVPVPIVPAIGLLTGRPLDLTCSFLRSPAQVHLEYLRNMGVQSSLTVSIIVRQRLWGMLACHHTSPRHVDYSIRSVCELMGQVLGAQVALRLDNAALQSRLSSRNLLQNYVAGIDEAESLFCTSDVHGERLLKIFSADGLISHINGVVMSRGYTVELPALLPLVRRLQELAVGGIAYSHSLSALDPSAASFTSKVSGALLIELTGESGDYILLLRREFVETVNWAGNPDKSVNTDADGRLRPRTSFGAWQQTLRNHSLPWTELQLETAPLLRLELLRLRGALEASQSNKRFRFLADTMPLLIWTATPDGKFDYYNERWLSYSSVPPAQLANWNWQEAIHPEDFPICLDRWKKTIASHCDYKIECRLKHGSAGDYRWTLAQAFPLRNNKNEIIQWIGTCTDIDDQKQARSLLERAVQERTGELAKARAQLQTVLDGATKVSIVATDTEGIITVFNSGAENMLGYTSQEIVGKQTPVLFHVEAELLARGLELTQEMGKTVFGFDVFAARPRQGMHEQREWTYVRKDGQRLTVNLVATVLRDGAGAIVGFLGVAMDITELKKAEAAARASDEHCRLIIETIEDYALMMLDAHGHIVSWNVGAERITGYQASEIIGQHFSGFHAPPEIETRHPDSVLQLAATEGRFTEEGWRIRKDGSGYWADVAIFAIRDESGNVRGFAKVVRDITKRRKSEEKVRDQALILDTANDAIVIRDIYDRITYWNQGAVRLYGWRRDEALGQVAHTLLKTQFPQKLESITEQLSSEGRWQGEVLQNKRDGTVITVASTWTLRHDEASLLASVVEMNHDITARKHAEEQLKIMSRRLELAKNSLGAGVWDWDIQTNVLIWDDRIYEIYDLRKGTQVTYQQWASFMLPEDLPAAEAALKIAIESKSQSFMEFRIKLPDGTIRHIHCAQGTVLDDAGKVARVVGVNIDITERKRVDSGLLEASNLLKLRVAELDAANKELAKKNEEVEAFVYIVSHDLRSPLVNLQGFSKELDLSCQELRQKLTSADQSVQTILSVDIPESLRHIESSTTKFHRLINSLLQLSRYGRQDYHHEELDLGALIRSTLDLLSLSIASGGVEVSVGSLPRVYGDATALGQVFANLVANAVKYMKPGRPGRIEIGGEALGGTAHCWVRDNGAGFPASAKPRLFQVFQRFHPNLAEGDGMGLAIVRRVVERHGGAIWADSEENVGTTFHFTLPSEPANSE